MAHHAGGSKLKIALMYGLLITVGIIAWVVIAHLLVPNPCSPIHVLGPIAFFNLVEITGIYLGIGARKGESAGQLQFKAGVKTGMGIAFVYGIGSCVFFLIFIAILGPQAMCVQSAVATPRFWQAAAFAFVGQFFGAVILGLFYSTIIAFVLATRRRVA